MFKRLFAVLGENATKRQQNVPKKFENETQGNCDTFLQFSDESLVEFLAGSSRFHLRMPEALAPYTNIPKALESVDERIKEDGLNNHPALADIVRELAAIPSSEVSDISRQAKAIIDAVIKNPWKELIGTSSAAKPEIVVGPGSGAVVDPAP